MQSHLPFLSLEDACEALARGKALLFPTETFYGLGCDAMNPDAVGAVFSIKKRSLAMPLPVVIGSMDKLALLSEHIDPLAQKLMDLFWPGPLSVILPARPEVPDLLTANAGRIAVRCSPHPAVLHLCRATDRILVASSANLSGVPAVVDPEHIDRELVRQTAGLYVEAPLPAGGLPSTIVDIVESREGSCVRVLRSGAISSAALQDVGFCLYEEGETAL